MRFDGLESAGVVLFLGGGIAVGEPTTAFKRKRAGRHDFRGALLTFRTRDFLGVHPDELFNDLAAFTLEFIDRHTITLIKLFFTPQTFQK